VPFSNAVAIAEPIALGVAVAVTVAVAIAAALSHAFGVPDVDDLPHANALTERIADAKLRDFRSPLLFRAANNFVRFLVLHCPKCHVYRSSWGDKLRRGDLWVFIWQYGTVRLRFLALFRSWGWENIDFRWGCLFV
jgi:hypothetical protein